MALGSSAQQRYADQMPAGLVWVDGIGRVGDQWRLETICVKPEGHVRQPMSLEAGRVLALADTRSRIFERAPTAMHKFSIADLSRAETVYDPRDVLDPLVPGIQASRRHQLIQVSDSPRVFVPALLLVRALFSGVKVLDQHLLLPNAIDLMGVARITGDAVHVTAGPAFGRSDLKAGTFARAVAWAQTCPDAKRSHASVLAHARQGEIGLSLPAVSMEFWAYGYEVDSGFLAYELNGVDVRLPIPRNELVLDAHGKTHRFASYIPTRKSPWSRDYEETVDSRGGRHAGG